MIKTKCYCVITRHKNGTEFLAHASDGAAVYFIRKEAFALARLLRTQKFKAHVVSGRVFESAERKKGKGRGITMFRLGPLGCVLILPLVAAILALAAALVNVSLTAVAIAASSLGLQCLIGLGLLILTGGTLLRHRLVVAYLAQRFQIELIRPAPAAPDLLSQRIDPTAQLAPPLPSQTAPRSTPKKVLEPDDLKDWGF